MITREFLERHNACADGIEWCQEHALLEQGAVPFLRALIAADKLDWANWLIIRVMTYPQYVEYACFAAEQVLPIWDAYAPGDPMCLVAIEASRKCIDDPTAENKAAARIAGNAAGTAGSAAWDTATGAAGGAGDAARATTGAAAGAAWAAGDAARAAAGAATGTAARIARDAAGDAARAAAGAAWAGKAAKCDMYVRILEYGMSLLEISRHPEETEQNRIFAAGELI